MAKKKTSFALSEDAVNQLAELAKADNRSMANMLEVLISNEFTLENPQKKK